MGIMQRQETVKRSRTWSGSLAALDIGTTKVCCLIAHMSEGGKLHVKGIGHHRSVGIKNGAVVDMDAAEASIRAAVDAAEQMAGEVIDHVVVNVSGGRPRSGKFDVEVAIDGHQVGDADMLRIKDCITREAHDADRELIHNIPLSYVIDGANGVLDPKGMYGERLGVCIHQVSAQTSALRNLATVVRRCHLEIEDWVASPYASALGCLVEDAMELGVTCLDMGGGTTDVAVFQNGTFTHMGIIPIGGRHVTGDIAQGLSTPRSDAERLKTLYGSAIHSVSDKDESLLIRQIGEDEDHAKTKVPRSMLNQIIQPRIEETLEMVRAHLDAANLLKGTGRLMVLTGGASQLGGMTEAASLILGKKVQTAATQDIKGLADSTTGPAFSTCTGLLRHCADRRTSRPAPTAAQTENSSSPWGRFGHWLQQNF